LREITQPNFEQADSIWQKRRELSQNSTLDFLVWPFDRATVEQHGVISKLAPEVWRAAYYDEQASLVQRTFERRKKADNELATSESSKFLGTAMRAFARIDKYGMGHDIQMRDLNRTIMAGDLTDPVFETMNTNFKTIDANGDGKISLIEYAKYLGERANGTS
jgi:hypothetical protein